MRTFSKDIFIDNIKDFNSTWVQMNHSFSKEQYTWRGFHFQNPPFKETKLLRCISGEIIDYVIDLRLGSKTFFQFSNVERFSRVVTNSDIKKKDYSLGIPLYVKTSKSDTLENYQKEENKYFFHWIAFL